VARIGQRQALFVESRLVDHIEEKFGREARVIARGKFLALSLPESACH